MALAYSKKKILVAALIALVVLGAIGGIAAGVYSGVNRDRYGGYVYEAGTNLPLAGVAVTNGRDVVRTDERGHYVLDGWLKRRFITVSIPSGYWTERYYIEAGAARDGYDFYLDKRDTDDTDHTFLQVTDTEINDESEVTDWVDGIRQTAQDTDAAFIMHTGDICYEQGLKRHIREMNTDNMGVPVRYAIGNHDYVKWGKYSEDLFESTYGPVNYSFDIGQIHYVVTAIGYGDYAARYKQSDVWRWLANDLAAADPAKKVVVFNHTFCPDENGFTVRYGTHKLDLKQKNLLAWVFGHWHYNYLNEIDGIFNISTGKADSGDIDSTPAAIRTVGIQGGQLARSELIYRNYKPQAVQDGAKWSVQVGGHGEFAEPVFGSGKIYVGTVDDGYPKQCGLYALDAETGETVWSYRTRNSIRNSFAISNNRLYAQDVEGRVYCLDADSGAEIWTYETGIREAANTGLNVLYDESGIDGRIYCGGPQRTYCLSAADGSVIWDADNARANCSPTRMVIVDNRLFVGSHWDELICYDKNTGKRLWANDRDGLRYRTTTPIVLSDGRMIVAAETKLFELDYGTGKIVRMRDVGINLDTASAPYVADGVGYFSTAKDGVVAFRLSDFEQLHAFRTGNSMIYTSPYTSGEIATVEGTIVPYGDDMVFGASDGWLYRLERRELHRIEKFYVGAPVLSSLCVQGDDVVAIDFSGRVTRVSMR